MSDTPQQPPPAAAAPAAPAPVAPPTPQEPAPAAASQQQAVPIAPTAPEPPAASNPIPAMNNPRVASLFNRMDRDARRVEHVVNIDGQNTLSGETYDQLQQLSTTPLPITRDEFIRMWKTLMLKRVQDVYEQEYLTRPENYIRINRGILMPAPLADALHALGSFDSTHTGRLHNIVQPARAANPENFWNVDNAIVRRWIQTVNYAERAYVMKEYPSQRETTGRPIVLTYRQTRGQRTRIQALTNEPTLSDGFLRLVNDDLFAAHDRYTVDNCALNMTMEMNEANIRGKYIAGYVTQRNI